MAKPVAGNIFYNSTTDRPRVALRVGERDLLTTDDSTGGAVSDVTGAGAIDASPTTGNVVVSLDESELEVGGAQEISIAGLSGQAADGQRASALVTTGADVVVSGAAPGTTGQVLTLTSATAASWQTNAAIAPEPWVKPASPDSRDDEFETTTLDSAWVLYDSAGTSPTAPTKTALLYGLPTGMTNRYQCHTDRKPSWLCTQSSSAQKFLLKPATMATDDSFWARLNFFMRYSSAGSICMHRLMICAATAGHPDPANRLQIGFQSNDDLNLWTIADKLTAGVAANIPAAEAGTLSTFARAQFGYFVIDKVGTTFRCYAHAPGIGTKTYQNVSITWTPAYVGFELRANGSNTDGDIFAADFIRGNVGGFLSLPI